MEEFVTPEVEEVVAGFFRGLTCPQGILPRFTEVVSHTLLEKKNSRSLTSAVKF
jgi:hypothetical protein